MLNELLDALANIHRRRLIVSLLEQDSLSVDRFVSQEVERGDRDREQLFSAVYHTHLPKLAEAEFIDWDRDTGDVTRGPNFTEIRPLVECLTDHADDLPGEWT